MAVRYVLTIARGLGDADLRVPRYQSRGSDSQSMAAVVWVPTGSYRLTCHHEGAWAIPEGPSQNPELAPQERILVEQEFLGVKEKLARMTSP